MVVVAKPYLVGCSFLAVAPVSLLYHSGLDIYARCALRTASGRIVAIACVILRSVPLDAWNWPGWFDTTAVLLIVVLLFAVLSWLH